MEIKIHRNIIKIITIIIIIKDKKITLEFITCYLAKILEIWPPLKCV